MLSWKLEAVRRTAQLALPTTPGRAFEQWLVEAEWGPVPQGDLDCHPKRSCALAHRRQ